MDIINNSTVKISTFLFILVLLYITSTRGDDAGNQGTVGERFVQQARSILQQVPLVDGHNDLTWRLRVIFEGDLDKFDLRQNHSGLIFEGGSPSQTDITRLKEGMVGSQFWAIFTHCQTQYKDGIKKALVALDTIKRVIKKYDDTFQFITTADGIMDAKQNNKIGSLFGLEGGHMIDSSYDVLRMFYELGIRYMTLTWYCNTPWADMSNPDADTLTTKHGGLTTWGQGVIREMNRLGMLVDLSHVAPDTMNDALDVTRAPVIFSHSSAYALCPHHRNVPDDVMRRVKDNGGLIMVNFYTNFINCTTDNAMESATRPASLDQVVDHLDHIKNTIGADHAGLGGDFDGVSRLPTGLEDVSKYPNLIGRMLERGWSEEDVKKVAGLNLIRVFRKAEQVRDELVDEKALINQIPLEDLPTDSCINYKDWRPNAVGSHSLATSLVDIRVVSLIVTLVTATLIIHQ